MARSFRSNRSESILVDLKRALDAAIGQEQVERNAIRDDYFEVFREEPPVPREPPAVLLVANVGEVDLLLMILGGREVKAAGQTLFEISPQPSPQRESWRFEPIGPVADKYRGGTFARPVDLQPGCTSRVEIAAAPKGPPRLASVNRMNVPVTVSVNGLAPFRLGASSASTNDLSSVGGMAEGAAAAARIASAMPGATRPDTARVASGVTSRMENPVPPVVRTRSHCSRSASRISSSSIIARSSGRRRIETTSYCSAGSSSLIFGPLLSSRSP